MKRLSVQFTNKQLLAGLAWLCLASIFCALGRVLYADHMAWATVVGTAGWVIAWIAGLHFGEMRAINRTEWSIQSQIGKAIVDRCRERLGA